VDALRRFHGAIQGAGEYGYQNNEALACERTALCFHGLDAVEEARTFMGKAYEGYGRWGAIAKQDDISERYAWFEPEDRKGGLRAPSGEAERPPNSPLRRLDLETVIRVSQAISGEIMLERLLDKTMQMAIANAGAQRGFLILRQDAALVIEVAYDLDRDEKTILASLPLEESADLSQAIVHTVARSLEPVILADAAKAGPFAADPYVANRRCKSILCMPILGKGELAGILYMENGLTAGAFTAERIELLSVIAAQAAVSIENCRLLELSTTDGLTKLCVHRYFQFLLDKEIERSRRYNRIFSIVMIDIDDFKRINDAYGHQAGDDVLRAVARLLREKIRSVDIAARYGGEEFVLIFPETDTENALIPAEKIRQFVENLVIRRGNEQLRVTISLGVATYPVHATEKGSLIEAADGAMYASKRAGKNRVSIAVHG
jgi:diguanylate cyclase (GGDEF)-like protein